MECQVATRGLHELEDIVDQGLATFWQVGNALLEIRDGKLYETISRDFDEYCQLRFGFSRRRANQIISATITVEEIGTIVPEELLPKTESQARALAEVADTPKAQAKVLKKAAKSAPKDANGNPLITAAAIHVAAESLNGTTATKKDDLLDQLSTDAPRTVTKSSAESIVIDELLGELRKAVEKPRAIIEKLKEAVQHKAKAIGGSFATYHGSLTRDLGKADKAIYPALTAANPKTGEAAVIVLAETWVGVKRQVDQPDEPARAVTSLKNK